jgi:hypothetical protein
MNAPTLAEIHSEIGEMPMDSQARVNMVIDTLRNFMRSDTEGDETVFAMLVIMQEWKEGQDAVTLALAEGMTRQ